MSKPSSETVIRPDGTHSDLEVFLDLLEEERQQEREQGGVKVVVKLGALALSAIAVMSPALDRFNEIPAKVQAQELNYQEGGGLETDMGDNRDYNLDRAVSELGLSMRDIYQGSSESLETLENLYHNDPNRELLPIFMKQIYQFEPQIYSAAEEYGIDPNIIAAVIEAESSGDPTAVSKANAIGLTQTTAWHVDSYDNLPSSASKEDMDIALSGGASKVNKEAYMKAMTDPEANINAGTKFIRHLLSRTVENNPDISREGAKAFVLMAIGYNYRPHLVDSAELTPGLITNLNSETKNYSLNMIKQLARITVAEHMLQNGVKIERVEQALRKAG